MSLPAEEWLCLTSYVFTLELALLYQIYVHTSCNPDDSYCGTIPVVATHLTAQSKWIICLLWVDLPVLTYGVLILVHAAVPHTAFDHQIIKQVLVGRFDRIQNNAIVAVVGIDVVVGVVGRQWGPMGFHFERLYFIRIIEQIV